MVVTLGANIASQRSQRQLAQSTAELGSVFERLSSGQRINRASDDAAGLAISSRLNSDVRVFNQGARNLSDGISMLNIAEGALQNLSQITLRITELAEQASNGVFSLEQRKALDKEANQLVEEYNRIVESTEFNGQYFFNPADSATVSLQGGYGENAMLSVNLSGLLQRNVGTGTFSIAFTLSHTNPHEVSGADFNGDGYGDLVAGGNSGLTVFLNDGSNNFTTTLYDTGGGPRADVGDIDNDGDMDIMTVNNTYVYYLRNNGDGTFADAFSVAHGGESNGGSPTLVDINNDNNLDFVFTGNQTNENVAVYIGNGDGTFQAEQSYATYAMATSARFLDFNGDDYLDMVFMNRGGNNTLTVLQNNGDGTFSDSHSFSVVSQDGRSLATGDFNHDGYDDMLVQFEGGADSRVLLSNGDGTFTVGYTRPAFSIGFGASDINLDGNLDIVTEEDQILFGNSDGTFDEPISIGIDFVNHRQVKFYDFNNDGVEDLMMDDQVPNIMGVAIADTEKAYTIASVNLLKPSEARNTLDEMENIRQRVTSQLGAIGASQSRAEVAINNLRVVSLISAQAAGRIIDADISQESANATRLGILQQAASAVLAQSNIQPELALSLLR